MQASKPYIHFKAAAASTTGTTTASASASATSSAASGFRFVGRVNPETSELTWPSTGVAFTFTGTTASININSVSGTTSVDLFIDGGDPIVIQNVNSTSISTGTLAYGTHTVELRKRSEYYFGTFNIQSVTTDGTLGKNTIPTRKIEIIGDSISVGYGLDGTYPCTNTAILEDNPLTYGAVAANALGADYSVVAWSGKGLIRNYATNPPDTSPLMPELYTRYGADDADDSFTFPSTWVPDAVVIALGTNDFSYLDVRDPLNVTAFTAGAVSFVQYIQQHYPSAAFFFMTSPMLSDTYPTAADAQHTTQATAFENAIAQLNGTKAYLVDWPTQGSDVGCDYHPIASTQAQGAALLEASIQSALGW